MGFFVSIGELKRAGFPLTADEAVAIAEKLIAASPDGAAQPPFGPLAAERVRVASDGSLVEVCGNRPAFFQVTVAPSCTVRSAGSNR